MTVFLSNIIFFFAEAASSGQGESSWEKFLHFWDTYFNYPGFEAWRFINLFIFGLVAYYILRKPLSKSFTDKREKIREDLIKAEDERKAAIAELASVEARIANLDGERLAIKKKADEEAMAEKKRIMLEADSDIARIQAQAESEIARKEALAKLHLRKFSAEESVRLAEERIKSLMNAKTDADLVRANIESIGGAK